MANCNDNIAMIAGTNAGIIAELLNDIIKNELENTCYGYGKDWCRCSMKTMTAYCPFLSVHQVKSAISLLEKRRLIVKGDFNESRFDHTNWYAFTEYGRRLLG